MKNLPAPSKMPVLPSPEELKSFPDPGARFEQWSKDCDHIMELNDELFEKALKRMKWCSFLNGMLNRPLTEHFAWCPHNDWDAYWQELGWPELPQMTSTGL